MKAINRIRQIGQSIWIDEITRRMLDDGTLRRYVDQYAVTGLTSNPTIFEKAIAGGDYDTEIARLAAAGKTAEDAFFELALADLRRAADLFLGAHEASKGVDGWVSMEVSPLLANDTQGTVASALRIHADAARRNLFVKIPGTPAGVPAIEQAIFEGVPINVTLLFSPEQYRASAEAYLRGLERRLAVGRDVRVESVASLFVSRWDKAVEGRVPASMKNQLGIAIAQRTYALYREIFSSDRWRVLEAKGARKQRLLFASTGTKDPQASQTLYVEAMVAPDTVDTMPVKTLEATRALDAEPSAMSTNPSAGQETLQRFTSQGVDLAEVAATLQREGAESFVKSWTSLMERVAGKTGEDAARRSA